jgi:hypothetical protein
MYIMRLLGAVLLISTPALAAAERSSKSREPGFSAGEKSFISACSESFVASVSQYGGLNAKESDESLAFGKRICECTAHEIRHERVSATALERETAHIRQDPKHKIVDPGVLSALQNCSIDALKGTEG